MYANDTILKLKKQRKPDPETKEKFPYNQVRVIGQSPVSHVHKGDWTGADAEGVIIVPLTNFGSTLDEPFGKLRTLYEVESVPEVTVQVATQVRVIDSSTAAAGQTPEEVFAEKAPGVAPEPGQVRGRTSPLGDVQNPKVLGPLDEPDPVGPSDSDVPA
jgi:uncharacterized GH25 family protein